MNILDSLKHVSDTEETLVIALFTLILFSSILDVLFGWVNAQFNQNMVFTSRKAMNGIARKMMYFIVIVFFTLVAYVMVPENIAFASSFTLITAYLASEMSSILGHLGVMDDGKDNEIFINFLRRIFNGKDDEK